MRVELVLALVSVTGTLACSSDTEPLATQRTPGDCPPIRFGGVPPAAFDCDCTIEIDHDRLAAGWIEVRFVSGAARSGRRQLGCTAQGLGGSTLEVLHEGEVVYSVESAPVQRLGPVFANSFPIPPRYQTSTGVFVVRASHGAWRSNEVAFRLPLE